MTTEERLRELADRVAADVRDSAPTPGASAYEIWLAAGNAGTEQDFLDSLVGPKGDDATGGGTTPADPVACPGRPWAADPTVPWTGVSRVDEVVPGTFVDAVLGVDDGTLLVCDDKGLGVAEYPIAPDGTLGTDVIVPIPHGRSAGVATRPFRDGQGRTTVVYDVRDTVYVASVTDAAAGTYLARRRGRFNAASGSTRLRGALPLDGGAAVLVEAANTQGHSFERRVFRLDDAASDTVPPDAASDAYVIRNPYVGTLHDGVVEIAPGTFASTLPRSSADASADVVVGLEILRAAPGGGPWSGSVGTTGSVPLVDAPYSDYATLVSWIEARVCPLSDRRVVVCGERGVGGIVVEIGAAGPTVAGSFPVAGDPIGSVPHSHDRVVVVSRDAKDVLFTCVAVDSAGVATVEWTWREQWNLTFSATNALPVGPGVVAVGGKAYMSGSNRAQVRTYRFAS